MPTASLTRRVTFAAAHSYRRPEWDDAKNEAVFGLCARPAYHGHTYTCDITIRGPIDATTGMILDLRVLDRALEHEVVARFDHRNLSTDVAEFADGRDIPTCENIARHIAERVQAAIGAAATVSAVTVAESPTLSATWRE
ncbi:MAG: 6-carboxytetrahydropterin synthase [Gemmatimonadetes bacterium]|nr:6-carboxytetrahydropterin synthase [Gemmatimonadota bacterium]